jgi:hypothetical protein
MTSLASSVRRVGLDSLSANDDDGSVVGKPFLADGNDPRARSGLTS